WKVKRNGFSLCCMGACADGKRIALVWWSATADIEVEVRGLRSGEIEGSPTVAFSSRNRGANPPVVKLTPQIVFLRTHDPEYGIFLEAWEIATGKRLWEQAGVAAFELSDDFKSLFVVKKGVWERVAADTGATLVKGGGGLDFVDLDLKFSAKIGSADGSVFSSQNGALRRREAHTGNLLWQSTSVFGTPVSLQFDRSSGTLAVLNRRSTLGAGFMTLAAASGSVQRSCAFVGKIADFKGFFPIAAKGGTFSVAFRERILVWRSLQSQPKFSVHSGSAFWFRRPLAGGNRLLSASRTGDAMELSVLDPAQNDLNKRKLDSVSVRGYSVGRVAQLSTDRDGTRVALLEDGVLAAYKLVGDHLEELWSSKKVGAFGRSFALHPSEDFVWVGDKVWEFSTGRELATLKGIAEVLRLGGAYSRNGYWVGSGRLVLPVLTRDNDAPGEGEKRMLTLWNAKTGEKEVQRSAPNVLSLAVSADGRWIAEGGSDKRIRIRNGQNLDVEREFRAHDREITGIEWHPRLPLMATSSLDGIVRIWSVESWKMVEELRVNSGETLLDIMGEGKQLIVTRFGGVEYFEPVSFQAAAQ
ncbi:MAG: hypothetical protein EBS01_10645, partial [Verrucomicrobia bacterium]|nr:hypothetical protein [Verrucomicrobiota bacterium]